MNAINKISKEIKLILDTVKDTVSKNILIAVNSGTLELDKKQLERLFQVIDASIDDTYHRSIGYFQRSASRYLEEEDKSKSKK